MSDDGFSDYYDEPNMEIQIETLMGTFFDLRVSSSETIQDIKQRIHRVEGIPVQQQNLIYHSRELKDSSKLIDVGIKNGSTIKLVLSMKGGPISTRRLSSAYEHHLMLKELKELLENTREEIGERLPGSKVSVLVFKEGDIINLLRVVENDDGSYSPYEKSISPPSKPPRNTCMSMFEKLVEDNEMMTKVSDLRKKMEEVSLRRQSRVTSRLYNEYKATDLEDRLLGEPSKAGKNYSYKLLTECSPDFTDDFNLEVFERSLDDENQSETEEIALKDKHRTKPTRLVKSNGTVKKSLYSETKGAYSGVKHTYARMHKKSKESKLVNLNSRERTNIERAGTGAGTSTSTSFSRYKPEQQEVKSRTISPSLAEVSLVKESKDELNVNVSLNEPLYVPSWNRLHLTRLVLSETTDRPKSSNSIELEENVQDVFEIHEPVTERIKHSATCKVGLYNKRRQSVDYGCENLDDPSNVKKDLDDYKYCNNSSEYHISNLYHMPRLNSISPQCTSKADDFYDYLNSTSSRSTALYGSRVDDENSLFTRSSECGTRLPALPKLTSIDKMDKCSFLSDCSSIHRLKNDCADSRILDDDAFRQQYSSDTLDEFYNYCNLGSEDLVVNEKHKKGTIELPPVIKKKARCNQCNKRLNITNIYNCRCGKIFCSQHRYSEVHRCNYDYKTEGKKILEQQNPLVTAEKLNRI